MPIQSQPSVKLFPAVVEETESMINRSYETIIKAHEIEATMQAYLMDIIEVITQTNNIIAKS